MAHPQMFKPYVAHSTVRPPGLPDTWQSAATLHAAELMTTAQMAQAAQHVTKKDVRPAPLHEVLSACAPARLGTPLC